jgi:hypothetical protein
MELTTAEEVHVVCLFPTPELAEAFGSYVRQHLPPAQNRPDYFGHQFFVDEEDHILGEETALLMAATDIPYCQVNDLVHSYGGAAFPAHIDHESFSALSNLGLWMPEAGFRFAELSLTCPPAFSQRSDLAGIRFLTNSDAHYLHEVPDAAHTITLPELSAQAVIDLLNSPIH